MERFRLKRADVLVASDRKTSSSPRAQSQVVPAGTSHPRFSWHANMQLPRERDKSSRAASSKTAEQNCRLHCRQNRRRPAPCRPPGPPLGQWGVCPIARGIAPYFLPRKPGQLSEACLFFLQAALWKGEQHASPRPVRFGHLYCTALTFRGLPPSRTKP